MTRRERLEAKLAKREEWAEGRRAKAATIHNNRPSYVHDWAFITQPGHIPARARDIRQQEKAFEHLDMAAHHESKAAGLERQLERSVFSDDDDAIEQLEAKIADAQAEQERHKAINKIVKRKPKNEQTPEKLADLAALGLSERLAAQMFVADFAGRFGIPSYELTNNNANIRRMQQRITEIKRRQNNAAEAEANGGIAISYSPDRAYCSVTFAEKPEYEIREALKAGGFRWGSGSWSGPTAGLPADLQG